MDRSWVLVVGSVSGNSAKGPETCYGFVFGVKTPYSEPYKSMCETVSVMTKAALKFSAFVVLNIWHQASVCLAVHVNVSHHFHCCSLNRLQLSHSLHCCSPALHIIQTSCTSVASSHTCKHYLA